ncbi:hypothetical protein KTH_18310 [Thermosporothrix hazakensis]|nr:hypothetical protein KTH_18310 [Thermosporothrix hazakensis]
MFISAFRETYEEILSYHTSSGIATGKAGSDASHLTSEQVAGTAFCICASFPCVMSATCAATLL